MSEIKVDETASYAHRNGGRITVVIRTAPGSALDLPAEVDVRLRAPGRAIRVRGRVTATSESSELVFDVARRDLDARSWRVAVSPDAGSAAFTRVRARLLARPGQPTALLTGPVPGGTRRPIVPDPRQPRIRQLARRLPDPVQGVIRKTRARVVDRVRGPQ